jgi:uncharacterized protein
VKLTGSHAVGLPRQQVWDALRDPAVLARALPGCESLEVTEPGRRVATVAATVASVSGTYRGSIRVVDQEPPAACRLLVEAAGVPGTIRGEASVRLEEDGDATVVHHDAELAVSGSLDGVGQRVLAGAASQALDAFFATLEREASAAPERAAPVVAERDVPVSAAPPEPAARQRRGLALVLAGLAGAAVAVIGARVAGRPGRRGG